MTDEQKENDFFSCFNFLVQSLNSLGFTEVSVRINIHPHMSGYLCYEAIAYFDYERFGSACVLCNPEKQLRELVYIVIDSFKRARDNKLEQDKNE